MSRWSLVSFFVLLNGCAPVTPDDLADAPRSDGTATSGDASADAQASEPTFENVQALFASRCSGYCHAGGRDIGASLVLQPEDRSVPMLVNQPSRQVTRMMLVAPGDPDNSYLVRKVEGTMSALPECAPAMNPCGIPMPYAHIDGHGAVTLPAAQRELIRRWVLDGAHVPAS